MFHTISRGAAFRFLELQGVDNLWEDFDDGLRFDVATLLETEGRDIFVRKDNLNARVDGGMLHGRTCMNLLYATL